MCDIQDNITKTTKAETQLTSSPMTRIEAQIKPAMIRSEPLKQLQGRGLPEPIRFSARGAREGATGGKYFGCVFFPELPKLTKTCVMIV